MTIQRREQVINANGIVELASGNYFLLLTASAAVNLRSESRGTSEEFDGMVGGLLMERVQAWTTIRITGVAGTTLEYFIGTENVTEDRTDIRLGVSAVAGTVATAERPSDSISDLVPVVASNPSSPAPDESVLIAANATRRRLRVTADSFNPGSCYVLAASGGNPIDELQAGTSKVFDTFQGLWITNANGADCTFYLCEEL